MATRNKRHPIRSESFSVHASAPGRINVSYRANARVFVQGEPADAVFYIQKGKAKVTVLSKNGKEAVLAIPRTRRFFRRRLPERPAAAHGDRHRHDGLLAHADRKGGHGRACCMIEPKFAELFIAYLLHRNSRVEEDLVDQLFNSSEKRLARTLLLLANFGKEASRSR